MVERSVILFYFILLSCFFFDECLCLSEIYNLDSLSNEDIFLHIMCAAEHDVLKSVFTFISSCFIACNCSNTSLVPVK